METILLTIIAGAVVYIGFVLTQMKIDISNQRHEQWEQLNNIWEQGR